MRFRNAIKSIKLKRYKSANEAAWPPRCFCHASELKNAKYVLPRSI